MRVVQAPPWIGIAQSRVTEIGVVAVHGVGGWIKSGIEFRRLGGHRGARPCDLVGANHRRPVERLEARRGRRHFAVPPHAERVLLRQRIDGDDFAVQFRLPKAKCHRVHVGTRVKGRAARRVDMACPAQPGPAISRWQQPVSHGDGVSAGGLQFFRQCRDFALRGTVNPHVPESPATLEEQQRSILTIRARRHCEASDVEGRFANRIVLIDERRGVLIVEIDRCDRAVSRIRQRINGKRPEGGLIGPDKVVIVPELRPLNADGVRFTPKDAGFIGVGGLGLGVIGGRSVERSVGDECRRGGEARFYISS